MMVILPIIGDKMPRMKILGDTYEDRYNSGPGDGVNHKNHFLNCRLGLPDRQVRVTAYQRRNPNDSFPDFDFCLRSQ
jgi:hypothetical protein